MQIFLFLFAFLSAISGWAAWRRSPSYSSKTTLRLVVVFTLIMGATIGLLIAVFNSHLSDEVQIILAVATAFAVAMGLTAAIIRITDAHVAQLPAAARIVSTERHKVQRWIWRTVVYLLVCGAVALVVPPLWAGLPLVLGGMGLLIAAPCFVALYMRARRLDLGMSAVAAAPWIHWKYSTADWRAWAAKERDRETAQTAAAAGKKDGRKIIKVLLIFALTCLVCAWWVNLGSLGVDLAASVAMPLVFYGIVLLANRANRNAPARHYRKLLAVPPEVLLGDEGVYANGGFSPWLLSGGYLIRAMAYSDPACLELVFNMYRGNTTVREARRIPIPAGGEAELPGIGQKLRRQCPKADVRLG